VNVLIDDDFKGAIMPGQSMVFHVKPGLHSFKCVQENNADTWEYYGASNPGETTRQYKGDKSTKTLEIVSISPRLEQQECPFCKGGDQSWFKGNAIEQAETGQEYFELWLEGAARLHIQDHAEQRLGFVDGEFLQEIPGASILWMKRAPDSSSVSLDPIFRIPQGPAFEFFIDGTHLVKETESGLSMIAPGYFISIDGIHLAPGAKDQVSMRLREDGTGQLIYRPNASETPVIMAGVETPSADFVYRAHASHQESKDDQLDMRVNPETGEFILSTEYNQGVSVFDISVQRYDEFSTSNFLLLELPVPPNTEVYIHYGDFEGIGEGFYAFADIGMDGTMDETYEIIHSVDPFKWNK
jgi:hypothetical protein